VLEHCTAHGSTSLPGRPHSLGQNRPGGVVPQCAQRRRRHNDRAPAYTDANTNTAATITANLVTPSSPRCRGASPSPSRSAYNAHSDGWLGIFVGSYAVAGGYAGTLIDERLKLWDFNSGWFDHPESQTGISGFPLSAWLPVDRSHGYTIWVWCGGSIASDGFYGPPYHGSDAESIMNITVPSIFWALF